ncbi:MAG: cupin domain-containing protein [Halopenitus sp.]
MAPVNERDLDWSTVEGAETAFKRKQLGAAAGGEQLGCSLYELPSGERSWPYHHHTANEEALYVLSGEGTLRLDGDEHDLAAGDYATFPANDSGAHRVVNDTDEPLRYLLFSTMTEPDVIAYPDLETIGVFAGSPPGGDGERAIEGYYELDETVDYWTGE